MHFLALNKWHKSILYKFCIRAQTPILSGFCTLPPFSTQLLEINPATLLLPSFSTSQDTKRVHYTLLPTPLGQKAGNHLPQAAVGGKGEKGRKEEWRQQLSNCTSWKSFCEENDWQREQGSLRASSVPQHTQGAGEIRGISVLQVA